MGLWLRSLLKEICLEQHAARTERWLQQHSGQTLGMREGIYSGLPRLISNENMRNNYRSCLAKSAK